MTTGQRWKHWTTAVLERLRRGNQLCCSSSPQNQQLFDYYQPTDANATGQTHLDIPEIPSNKPQKTEQTFHEDSSEYKTYLIEYQYKGQAWGSEILATSREDAEARLRCLMNGTVLGPLVVSIPVPEAWCLRIRKWLNIF